VILVPSCVYMSQRSCYWNWDLFEIVQNEPSTVTMLKIMKSISLVLSPKIRARLALSLCTNSDAQGRTSTLIDGSFFKSGVGRSKSKAMTSPRPSSMQLAACRPSLLRIAQPPHHTTTFINNSRGAQQVHSLPPSPSENNDGGGSNCLQRGFKCE
jgi:hypothetical protein